MANFMEDLWNSIFTPGPTPTLLVATNASFAALQLLLLLLLIATHSVHFIVLSVLCGGLWWSINWFAGELQSAKAIEEAEKRKRKDKSPEPSSVGESDTETEVMPPPRRPPPVDATNLLKPQPTDTSLRKRSSQGDSSGYVSTDSEWEKISESEEREK